MKQDLMLMLVVAFLLGLFFKQITGQVCGRIEGMEKGPLSPPSELRRCWKMNDDGSCHTECNSMAGTEGKNLADRYGSKFCEKKYKKKGYWCSTMNSTCMEPTDL